MCLKFGGFACEMEQESRMWSLPKDVTSTNVLPVAHLKAQQQQLCTSSLCRPCQTWVLPVKSGGDTPVPPPPLLFETPPGGALSLTEKHGV